MLTTEELKTLVTKDFTIPSNLLENGYKLPVPFASLEPDLQFLVATKCPPLDRHIKTVTACLMMMVEGQKFFPKLEVWDWG